MYQGGVPLSIIRPRARGDGPVSGKIGDFARYIHENPEHWPVRWYRCTYRQETYVMRQAHHDRGHHRLCLPRCVGFIKRYRHRDENQQRHCSSSTVDTDKFLTSAEDVLVIMKGPTTTWSATLPLTPSPDKFVQNATIMTVPELHTPITTAEYTTV